MNTDLFLADLFA